MCMAIPNDSVEQLKWSEWISSVSFVALVQCFKKTEILLTFFVFQVKDALQSSTIIFKMKTIGCIKTLKCYSAVIAHRLDSNSGPRGLAQPVCSLFRLAVTSCGSTDFNSATRKIWVLNSKPVKSGLQSKPIIFSDTSCYRWFYLNAYSCNWSLVPFPKANA